MNRTHLLAALGVLGWLLSWLLMGRWLADHGGALFMGWAEAFTASDFATGLLLDLVVVSLMLIAVALVERRRLGTWVAVAMVASLCLSASVSLAIYLGACWRRRGP